MVKRVYFFIFQATTVKFGNLLGVGSWQQMQHLSPISLKLRQIGHKIETWAVNTTIAHLELPVCSCWFLHVVQTQPDVTEHPLTSWSSS